MSFSNSSPTPFAGSSPWRSRLRRAFPALSDFLFCLTPLLERLQIRADCAVDPHVNTAPSPTLFGADLSSLRELQLRRACTELPWRDISNFVSLELGHKSPYDGSATRVLDFLQSAPHLREVKLDFVNPVYDARHGRLVPPPCLKDFCSYRQHQPSLLFGHLSIPAGADITIKLSPPRVSNSLPRSLDDLRNLSNFTKIYIHFGQHPAFTLRFTEQNGGSASGPQLRGWTQPACYSNAWT